jgi:hypothetical protein
VRDVDFFAGNFFEQEIPKDKAFLKKYFKSESQRAFLKYYLVFGDYSCFTAHTGQAANHSYLFKQEVKLKHLLEVHKQAKSNMDFDLVWKIESGKYKYKYNPKTPRKGSDV